MTDARKTPLFDLHQELGARMVEFAGWSMPVQYPAGVMAEHKHTRDDASFFDVSHMGQIILQGDGAAEALEALIPADIIGIPEGRQRYGMFTNDKGGILDDLMIANRGDHLLLVVNAARTDHDLVHLGTLAARGVTVEHVTDRVLIAVQGPRAAAVMTDLLPEAGAMRFMDMRDLVWRGTTVWVARGGYTGEDGFEISLLAALGVDFARELLARDVQPAGLGARDSLRLEAGLPLYGNDMDETITPVEAGLAFSIQKIRRKGGAREGGFPGADRILTELADGPSRRRQGLRPEGRAPLRPGVPLFDTESGGSQIGSVTSGGFSPTIGGPIAMAMLPPALTPGARIWAELRGKRVPVDVVDLPFVSPSYKR